MSFDDITRLFIVVNISQIGKIYETDFPYHKKVTFDSIRRSLFAYKYSYLSVRSTQKLRFLYFYSRHYVLYFLKKIRISKAAFDTLILKSKRIFHMKVTGIIAEYNPFHNGHLYQLKKAKEATNADYLIVAMSGDFVQRGAPALIDKYTRAKMALSCGADLVLELPVLWSTASAEYFSSAGIALLDQIGVTDAVCFGCETVDTEGFFSLARFLSEETAAYRSALNTFLKNGNSYPKAREQAVLASITEVSHNTDISPGEDSSSSSLSAILSSPNNILGLEYCKALYKRGSSIQPFPIQRVGKGYHEEDLDSDFVSATGIRSYLNGTMDFYSDLTALKEWMPEAAFSVLCDALKTQPLLFEEDFSAMLGYRLLLENSFISYADSSSDLSDRICRMRKDYISIPDFLEDLKTKEVTYTRLSRLLFHILLDIKEKDYRIYRNLDYTPYGKILGFRESATPLLRSLKSNSSIPVLTGPLDKKKLLSEDATALLKKDIFASEVYRLGGIQKSGGRIANEYERKFLKI